MLFAIIQLITSKCRAILSALIQIWTRGTTSTEPLLDIERGIICDPQNAQRNATQKQTKAEFIKSLSQTRIRELASRYNGDKSCEIFGINNGSFNVCFFIKFPEDSTRWVVRVPIESALQQPWEKLQSEVATINYIRHATTIPVPCIRAFGRDEILTDDETKRQMFIISDYINGISLTPNILQKADRSVRSRLFCEIFGIFVQLRKLRFDTIGSLMPGRSEEKPIVSNLLTFSMNEIPGARLPTFSTAQEFLQSQFDMIRQYSALPAQNLTESDARFEIFAIYSLEKYFTAPDEANHGPFVLHHPDLRLQNIIVNDDLEVQAVIDWEFAHTVPLSLSVPPSWATGHDPELVLLTGLFQLELRDAAVDDEVLSQLRHEWYASKSNDFNIAHIVRYPGDVSTVFDEYFVGTLFGDGVEKAESDFFKAHAALGVEAQRRAKLWLAPPK